MFKMQGGEGGLLIGRQLLSFFFTPAPNQPPKLSKLSAICRDLDWVTNGGFVAWVARGARGRGISLPPNSLKGGYVNINFQDIKKKRKKNP